MTCSVQILESEVDVTAIRAQGAGGQNVNKVSSAIHLRFNVAASSLPPELKARVLSLSDRRITKDGVLVIKAQQFRTQELNRLDAYARLQALVQSANTVPTFRKATKPTRASTLRRLDGKSQRGQIKSARARIVE